MLICLSTITTNFYVYLSDVIQCNHYSIRALNLQNVFCYIDKTEGVNGEQAGSSLVKHKLIWFLFIVRKLPVG